MRLSKTQFWSLSDLGQSYNHYKIEKLCSVLGLLVDEDNANM